MHVPVLNRFGACEKVGAKALGRRGWACWLVAEKCKGKFRADERGRVSTLQKVVVK